MRLAGAERAQGGPSSRDAGSPTSHSPRSTDSTAMGSRRRSWARSWAGVHTTGAPHNIYTDADTGVEEWMAFFEDLDGKLLALMSQVAR